MVCPCLIIPFAAFGVGLSANSQLIIGFLLTIFSLSLYLHYTEFSKDKCKECL